jgi:hypothetical protein
MNEPMVNIEWFCGYGCGSGADHVHLRCTACGWAELIEYPCTPEGLQEEEDRLVPHYGHGGHIRAVQRPHREDWDVSDTNIYTIDCYTGPEGGRAHVTGRDRGWEAWSFGVGDMREDPRWLTDLDWMAQELMEGFATFFRDGETFEIVDKRIGPYAVFVDVNVIGEPGGDEDAG